ncbi:MAG: CIA30 family protein [Bacteroidetes bacterium]|nr:MAG: CIA30 family protein [Bacteroidota bacterium]
MTLNGNVNSNPAASDETLLFDFGTLENMDDWLIVNDGVMGGLSRSSFVLSDRNTAVFSGIVRLENNGGFASVRTRAMQFQLDGFKGILIRVKGDGKTYQFRLRTSDRFDGVAYRYHFETKANQWQTIAIPFDEFVPVFRGRILRDVEPVSPKNIQQVGIMASDNQTGEFQLEIQWIKSYR